MKIRIFRLMTLALLMGQCGIGTAETRYITDVLEVTVRSGQSTKNSILKLLPSGTPVEVLEVDNETKYTRIRTRAGLEGWVLTRYLLKTPSARDRLAEAEQKLATLTDERRQLTEQAGQADKKSGEQASTIVNFQRENERLGKELAQIRKTAANSIAISQENRTLKTQIASLQHESQLIQQENTRLTTRVEQEWFIIGAGVILLGMIIGLIIPKIRWKRKKRWNEF